MVDRVNAANYATNTLGKRVWQDTNLGLGITGTEFAALWHNGMQESVIEPIEGVGLVPTDADNTQLFQTISRLAASNVTAVSATGALTAAEAGIILVNASAGNVTLTLPAANGISGTLGATAQTNRLRFDVIRIDTSANAVSLVCPGGSSFFGGGSSIPVGVGQTVTEVSDGSAVYYSLSGGAGISVATSVGGTANAITLAAPPSASGLIQFTAISNNTAATTFTINGGAAISGGQGGVALSGGEIDGGSVYIGMKVGATFWLLCSMAGAVNVGAGSAPTHAVNLGQWTKGGSTSIVLPSATASNGTIGSSGWSKDPNGLIKQWAYIQSYDQGSGSVTTSWPFPISFASPPLKFRATNVSILAGQGSPAFAGIPVLTNMPTASGLQFTTHDTLTTGTLVCFFVEVEGY